MIALLTACFELRHPLQIICPDIECFSFDQILVRATVNSEKIVEEDTIKELRSAYLAKNPKYELLSRTLSLRNGKVQRTSYVNEQS